MICIGLFHALVVIKIRYAIPTWGGFLSAHVVGQINGFFKKRAHRYGFILDVITAESADSTFFKSIRLYSDHCQHFLLPPPPVKDQVLLSSA